jgi:hypothetical protein
MDRTMELRDLSRIPQPMNKWRILLWWAMPGISNVTAVIEACGGDRRTAMKACLVEQHIQEQRIERLAAALSFG